MEAVLPKATVQTSIVHVIRNSMRFLTWEDRKAVALAPLPIYSAQTDVLAEVALTTFGASAYGVKNPMFGKSWRANSQGVISFIASPRDIRKVISTANASESLIYSLRTIIRTHAPVPSEEAATKLRYLALVRAEKRWTMQNWNWEDAMDQFVLPLQGRPVIQRAIEGDVELDRRVQGEEAVEASELATPTVLGSGSLRRAISHASTARLRLNFGKEPLQAGRTDGSRFPAHSHEGPIAPKPFSQNSRHHRHRPLAPVRRVREAHSGLSELGR